ncbi:MAG: AmmeMemoRadiSam system protein B [Armatimonadota bacterium]|nr:AmmeMemoRadiSam system protein B [Armatimonadota bacterium]
MKRRVTGALLAMGLLGALALWGCRPPQPSDAHAAPQIGVADEPAAETVREPAVAGAFYPGDPDELRATVREMLEEAEAAELPGPVIGLMAPHAGYVYSGSIAAAAYAQLRGADYDTVIIIGPSHRWPTQGIALPASDVWRTPLGEVPVDRELCAALAEASDRFHRSAQAHGTEHCLEVQLPFLQMVLDDFAIVPLVMHDFSEENCSAAADAIVQVAADRSVLLVASTDMSHYPAYEDANRVDRAMLEAIASFDAEAVRERDAELMAEGMANLSCTLCGLGPVAVVMEAARRLGADSAVVIDYANSGDSPMGEKGQCVGYGAAAFCAREGREDTEAAARDEGPPRQTAEAGELNAEQQRRLLALARETVEAVTAGEAPPEPPADDPAFQPQRAVFVTLNKQGRLRGCIGSLQARQPLGEAVISSAASAATEDPRFMPVTAAEVDELEIEISVLSPLRTVDDPEEIMVGEHGVIVSQGRRRGVFLPQVAPEQGWDREEMLAHLCAEKAGLPPDAWQKGATLQVFTAQVFSEAVLRGAEGER